MLDGELALKKEFLHSRGTLVIRTKKRKAIGYSKETSIVHDVCADGLGGRIPSKSLVWKSATVLLDETRRRRTGMRKREEVSKIGFDWSFLKPAHPLEIWGTLVFQAKQLNIPKFT
jgi:hypothetical protein